GEAIEVEADADLIGRGSGDRRSRKGEGRSTTWLERSVEVGTTVGKEKRRGGCSSGGEEKAHRRGDKVKGRNDKGEGDGGGKGAASRRGVMGRGWPNSDEPGEEEAAGYKDKDEGYDRAVGEWEKVFDFAVLWQNWLHELLTAAMTLGCKNWLH
ncbi:hypothetical protein Salat_2099400, partial [Sesamum alatum]